MKKILLFLTFLTAPYVSTAEDGYRLVWADEFEQDGPPSSENWSFEEGFVRNAELQWYQTENAFCEDGKLIIEGRRERRANPNYIAGSDNFRTSREFIEYTSSCLKTKGLHSWKYGRFEIKAKIKAEEGLWPAIWFLGVEGKWPSNGEIDLMEYYEGKILANACWASEGSESRATWDTVKKPVSSFNDPNWDDHFHLWTMEWDREKIRLYVDDLLLNEIDLSETINPAGKNPRNPFQQPHYILLNLAIGGTQGGDPSNTSFPSRYEIEYVRVYQKQESGE